jgi:hypothetical protein
LSYLIGTTYAFVKRAYYSIKGRSFMKRLPSILGLLIMVVWMTGVVPRSEANFWGDLFQSAKTGKSTQPVGVPVDNRPTLQKSPSPNSIVNPDMVNDNSFLAQAALKLQNALYIRVITVSGKLIQWVPTDGQGIPLHTTSTACVIKWGDDLKGCENGDLDLGWTAAKGPPTRQGFYSHDSSNSVAECEYLFYSNDPNIPSGEIIRDNTAIFIPKICVPHSTLFE